MQKRIAQLAAAAAATVAIALASACANDGYGTEACRQIEAERCRFVVACNIGVGVRRDNESSPVDDCVRYYRDSCMHGMTYATQEPTDTQTANCVAAIHNATSCDIIFKPENDPACSWIKPATDGGTDADAAVEAASDATGQ